MNTKQALACASAASSSGQELPEKAGEPKWVPEAKPYGGPKVSPSGDGGVTRRARGAKRGDELCAASEPWCALGRHGVSSDVVLQIARVRSVGRSII